MRSDDCPIARMLEALVEAGLVPPARCHEAEQVMRQVWDGHVGLAWTAADVRELCPRLDDEEARQVLRRVADYDCDSVIGEMIHAAAEELYGEKAFAD